MQRILGRPRCLFTSSLTTFVLYPHKVDQVSYAVANQAHFNGLQDDVDEPES